MIVPVRVMRARRPGPEGARPVSCAIRAALFVGERRARPRWDSHTWRMTIPGTVWPCGPPRAGPPPRYTTWGTGPIEAAVRLAEIVDVPPADAAFVDPDSEEAVAPVGLEEVGQVGLNSTHHALGTNSVSTPSAAFVRKRHAMAPGGAVAALLDAHASRVGGEIAVALGHRENLGLVALAVGR